MIKSTYFKEMFVKQTHKQLGCVQLKRKTAHIITFRKKTATTIILIVIKITGIVF